MRGRPHPGCGLSRTAPDDWQAILDVNLTARYLYSVVCLPALRAAIWTIPPCGRFAEGSDVAALVAYLASDEAGHVSGAPTPAPRCRLAHSEGADRP